MARPSAPHCALCSPVIRFFIKWCGGQNLLQSLAAIATAFNTARQVEDVSKPNRGLLPSGNTPSARDFPCRTMTGRASRQAAGLHATLLHPIIVKRIRISFAMSTVSRMSTRPTDLKIIANHSVPGTWPSAPLWRRIKGPHLKITLAWNEIEWGDGGGEGRMSYCVI